MYSQYSSTLLDGFMLIFNRYKEKKGNISVAEVNVRVTSNCSEFKVRFMLSISYLFAYFSVKDQHFFCLSTLLTYEESSSHC